MINEKGDIINNPTEIQRIIRDYNEQLHVKKHPRKNGRILISYNLLRLNHKYKKMNKPITNKDIELVILILKISW